MNRWQKETTILLVVAIAALVILGQLLIPGTAPYSPHSDIVAAHLSIKQALYESWQSGQGIPFWRSDFLSGVPGLAHPQTLYTNPFQVLFFALPAVEAVGPTIWIHLLVTGIAYATLGAALGLGVGARILMGVAGLYAFKVLAITYAGWLSVLPMVSMLPLLTAAVLHLMERPQPRSALALAAGGALCLHSGHLQLLYYALLLLIPYFTIGILRGLPASDGSGRVRAIALGGLAAAIAAGCSAYLWIPLASEASLISRGSVSYAYFLGGLQATPADLLTFLRPEATGSPLVDARDQLWERVAYFGAIPELLALVGASVAWRRRHGSFLLMGFAATLLLAFDSPINRLLYDTLPGYAIFRGPNRFLFLTTMFGIALAGVGFDAIRARMSRWPAAALARRALPFVLVAVTTAEGGYWASRYVTTAPTDFVDPPSSHRAFFAADDSIFRVAPIRRSTLNYGWASSAGIELVTGFEPYNYAHYQTYFDLLRGQPPATVAPVWTDLHSVPRGDLLDALNVKYVATATEVEPPEGYRLVAAFESEPRFVFYDGMRRGALYLYRNEDAFERAYWAPEILPVAGIGDAALAVRSRSLREVAVVEGFGPAATLGAAEDSGPLRLTKPNPQTLRVETENPNAGFLVLSEVWHPGWQARIDGVPAPIRRTNVTLMGVAVPPGPHAIELAFRPQNWRAALVVTAVSATAFLLLGIRALRRGAGSSTSGPRTPASSPLGSAPSDARRDASPRS